MPLIILGLIVLIGLLIFAIVSYFSDANRPSSNVDYSKTNKHKKSESKGDGKALYFPTENIDKEKHKRNIH